MTAPACPLCKVALRAAGGAIVCVACDAEVDPRTFEVTGYGLPPDLATLPLGEVVDLGDVWPWPAVSDARRAGQRAWFKISEVHADHALECVPPIYLRGGGFFMGEPAAHDDRGVAVHAAVIRTRDAYYMREVALDRIEDARAELYGALDGAS